MQRSGGVVIHMQTDLSKITFLVGNPDDLRTIGNFSVKRSFDEDVLVFLNEISKNLMHNSTAKNYPDVVTLAFWLRKASLNEIKNSSLCPKHTARVGRGVAFHISPSNVPINFAYSLFTGVLAGNANIVRVPSKEFVQISMVADAINRSLENHKEIKPYIFLIRYDHDKQINDCLSSMADVRVIWGGDSTISELRKSEIPPRSTEITFADRYSIAVIDSDSYLSSDNKKRIAEDFYNDTYLTDQNACTSPRLVVWTGDQIEEAKQIFWNEEYELVKQKYSIQAVQSVDKLVNACLIGAKNQWCHEISHLDNLLVRVKVEKIDHDIMDYRGNSGLFYEYDCSDIREIRDICNDTKCQTVGYIGNPEMIKPLVDSGIKGVDRVVPIGQTMNYDLIWDGYDLIGQMTRLIKII